MTRILGKLLGKCCDGVMNSLSSILAIVDNLKREKKYGECPFKIVENSEDVIKML